MFGSGGNRVCSGVGCCGGGRLCVRAESKGLLCPFPSVLPCAQNCSENSSLKQSECDLWEPHSYVRLDLILWLQISFSFSEAHLRRGSPGLRPGSKHSRLGGHGACSHTSLLVSGEP